MPGLREGKKSEGRNKAKGKKEKTRVARRWKRKKDLIAPMIFEGSLNAVGFEGWLEQYLLPSLERKSVLS